MATPSEKLAISLQKLKKLQDKNIVAIGTNVLSRTHRNRLLKNGFLKEIVKGWYISTPHHELQGDSTSWYTSYWDFCSGYLKSRFKKDYCISAEQSLLIHAGNDSIPRQLIIRSSKGTNSLTSLPHNTSLFSMKSPLPAIAEIIEKNGLQILSLPSALIYSSPSIFQKNSVDTKTALSMIGDASEILGLLLDGGHSTIAGRLAGAFRNIKQPKIADEILATMKSAGYDVRELNPFENETIVQLSIRERSPYANRVKLMWQEMRLVVLNHFPKEPGIPKDKKFFLKQIKEVYTTDAYHSLSIEKYKVTPELIENVKSGNWNFNVNKQDNQQKDAMAARGYWQASEAVRKSIQKIFKGENSGNIASDEHHIWYRELFAPSVAIGLLKPSDLAGYRNSQVYIGQSKHVPINKEGIRDVMPVLFELLENEKEASVRAVLGHFIFVFTHPYIDGNGRIGRFLMNVMLTSGGYPWTVIPFEERETYMNALESASVDQNIEPFVLFLAHLVDAGMKGNPVATI